MEGLAARLKLARRLAETAELVKLFSSVLCPVPAVQTSAGFTVPATDGNVLQNVQGSE